MIDHDFFGKDATLHHIGLAVDSIRTASPSSEVIANETQGVSMAFVRMNGVTIELLEPLGSKSPVAKSLREGVKLLHLCYEVADLEASLEHCRAAGFHRISRPLRVPEFDDRRVVWVFSNQLGLFELIEEQGDTDAAGSDRATGGNGARRPT